MNKLLTTKQLADHYQVSRQAVHEWRKLGLCHVKLGEKTLRYDLQETHQWLIGNMGNRKNSGVIK